VIEPEVQLDTVRAWPCVRVPLLATACGGSSAGSQQDVSGAIAASSVVTVVTPDGPQTVPNESGPDIASDGAAQQDPRDYTIAYEYCSRWPSEFTVDEQRSIIALGEPSTLNTPTEARRSLTTWSPVF
jgi:hypothetical protein